MANPIVVSQLMAKRAELAGEIEARRLELNGLLRDLDHIDGALRLFAPEQIADLIPIRRKRPKDQHFARNELMRRTLEALRQATEPLCARAVALRIAQEKGLDTDRRSMVLLTKRVVDALKRQERHLESRMDGRARVWWLPKPA